MAVETLFRKGAIIYKQDAFKPFSSQCSYLIPYGCFSRFLNCTNGTKSRNVSLVLRLLNYARKHELVFLLMNNAFLTKSISFNAMDLNKGLKMYSTNFTWFILEYPDPHVTAILTCSCLYLVL